MTVMQSIVCLVWAANGDAVGIAPWRSELRIAAGGTLVVAACAPSRRAAAIDAHADRLVRSENLSGGSAAVCGST